MFDDKTRTSPRNQGSDKYGSVAFQILIKHNLILRVDIATDEAFFAFESVFKGTLKLD
jgi:hypothetical protein